MDTTGKFKMPDNNAAAAAVMASAVCMLFVAAIEEEEEPQRKRSCWVKEYRTTRDAVGNTQMLMKEMKPNSADYFLRMDEDSFNTILNHIRSDIIKVDPHMRAAISCEEKLSITLRFLATGENFTDLDYNSKMSRHFLSGAILEFPETVEEWAIIANMFESKYQFPNRLGALNGKHIAFRPAKQNAALYYNYKGYHSLVLLSLADAQAKFIFIDVGCNGRISDGGVLQRSNFMYILEQPEKFLPPKKLVGNQRLLPHVFVADNAFPLSEDMVTPYPFTTTDENKKVFNKRLSRARQTIERAFGILSNRFRVFQKLINLRTWYNEYHLSGENQDTTKASISRSTKSWNDVKAGEAVRKIQTEYFNNEGKI